MKNILAALCLLASLTSAAPLSPENLRTELAFQPQAVGTAPRFSWTLASSENGKRQSAYQILAATSPDKLSEKSADFWNSGKYPTGLKNLVPWKGKDLAGVGKVFWKVRVWDETGKPGPWSQTTHFQVDGKATLPEPKRISTFESSSPELNQLYADSIDVLEKRLNAFAGGDVAALGKGDQVHRSARAILYHFEAVPHLTRWLRLIDKSLLENKTFPVQPDSKDFASVSSEAAIMAHHPVWWMGGDSKYPMERWKLYEDHMIAREKNDRAFKGTQWGSTSATEGMSPEFQDLVYLGFTTRLIRELAAPAQQPLNVIRFKDYAARIRVSFEKQYLDAKGSLTIPSQSAHVVALRSAVLKPEQQQQVIDDLLDSLSKKGPQVGPAGAHFLPGVLTLTGHQNEAVGMLGNLNKQQRENFIGNGISAWFMAYLAGIDTSFPGFQQIMIAPRIPTDDSVTWVKSSYQSPAGLISVHWQKGADGKLKADITIPAGVIARIKLPAAKGAKISESGQDLSKTPTVEVMNRTDDTVNFISQSGSYSFVIE